MSIRIECVNKQPRQDPHEQIENVGGSGACLDPYASDYDCEGGSGDGPLYTGTVTVVGSDHYGLDSNNNGVGCEP